MNLIEVEAILEEGGIIRIPQEELEAMKLREGDQICLLYLEQEAGSKINGSKEFILEKR